MSRPLTDKETIVTLIVLYFVVFNVFFWYGYTQAPITETCMFSYDGEHCEISEYHREVLGCSIDTDIDGKATFGQVVCVSVVAWFIIPLLMILNTIDWLAKMRVF